MEECPVPQPTSNRQPAHEAIEAGDRDGWQGAAGGGGCLKAGWSVVGEGGGKWREGMGASARRMEGTGVTAGVGARLPIHQQHAGLTG
jgi:hypothetical protein